MATDCQNNCRKIFSEALQSGIDTRTLKRTRGHVRRTEFLNFKCLDSPRIPKGIQCEYPRGDPGVKFKAEPGVNAQNAANPGWD